ncbi:hypothetical protein [Maricaulis sp.]|uniref:hypothetical protein n=1 Tax=Maricaulis sp. TaxID=1486257 RepID=UPI00329832BB
MILTGLAALLVTSEPVTFSEDPADHSAWMQHACRIQQVDRSGGVPEDHDAFCSCLDAYLQENATPQVYRLFALGSQGAIQDRSMLPDWEAARDISAAEAGALPAEEQAGLMGLLQGGLGACFSPWESVD